MWVLLAREYICIECSPGGSRGRQSFGDMFDVAGAGQSVDGEQNIDVWGSRCEKISITASYIVKK